MGLMNERATDQMGCAHPWPVLVDLCVHVCLCVCVCVRKRAKETLTQIEMYTVFIS